MLKSRLLGALLRNVNVNVESAWKRHAYLWERPSESSRHTKACALASAAGSSNHSDTTERVSFPSPSHIMTASRNVARKRAVDLGAVS